ncbi:LuxR C-terminal-related transcriptional regulator [Nocardia neocaledoniensis]|uniref:LuxR C-terminal-related transcriptional regulator n=1 Tax=Nocardia neocaledoniensis TaxID=236511 RepID=UPI0024588CB5|nr:LuxR family transcriptional regulator [Nocardia neocaledoniensis]
MIERAFVGRAAELAALTATFATPEAPWLLLVEGPAGIGKSRLIAHFADTAPCRVLLVTGTEDAQPQPRYLADDIAEQLGDSATTAGDAAAASRVRGTGQVDSGAWDGVPIVRGGSAVLGAGTGRLPGEAAAVADGAWTADRREDEVSSAVEVASAGEPGPDGGCVRGAIGGFVGAGTLSGEGGSGAEVVSDVGFARRVRGGLGAVRTLLVVDDVHWADPESLRVLAFVIRNRPKGGFRLVLAYRDGACPPMIARLLRASHVRSAHLRIPPFTAADVHGLLPEETPARRARLLCASHGNPLYLSLLAALPDPELERTLRGENPDPSHDYAVLDRTIRAELAHLPETERTVAQAAAVCGVPPDLELLGATAGLPEQVVADALDGLVRRGVIVPGGDTVAFVHPLVRTAAYRSAGPGWRTMAHRRAAQALRARDAPMPARAGQLEHAMLGPDEVAGAELRQAAAQVIADTPAASARWLAIAQRIAPSTVDPLADAVALGRAQLLSGAAVGAGETLDAAIATPGPHQLEALLLAARCARMLGRVDRARSLLARAADLPRRVGDGPVQLELAILEMQDHQDADGQARLDALFGSAAIEDPAVRAAATALRAIGFIADGRLNEAEQLYPLCDRALSALDDTGFREVVHAVPAFGWCAYFLDHDVAGLVHLERAIRVSRRYGRTYAIAELHTVRAYSLAKLGRLDDAIAAADDATAAATTFHYPDLLAFAGAIKLRTLQLTAPADQVAAQWHTVAALTRPAMRWWRQVVDTTLTETARALHLPVPDTTPLDQRPGPLHPTHLARATQAALATGDLPTAATLVTRAEEVCGGDSAGLFRGSQVGAVALARAEYAAATGDLVGAERAAGVAIAAFTRAGMVVNAAQAELFAGIVAGRRGDFGVATSRFATARAVFAAAGAHRLVAETTSAQRRLAGSRPVGGADMLTRREREVADLAARGHTNKDIAALLYLSPRTVEDHLSRVLRKLGLTGRAGIARRLDELDSTPA